MKKVEYFFKVVYLKNSVFETVLEKLKFKTQQDAHIHFKHLLEKYNVDGMAYYLCSWGESKDEQCS